MIKYVPLKENKKQYTTVWVYKDDTKEYATEYAILPDPFAKEKQVDFRIAEVLDGPPLAGITYNISKKSIKPALEEGVDKALSEKMVEELSEEDKTALQIAFAMEMENVLDRTDLKSLDPPDFSWKEIEEESLPVAFNSIFSWAQPFLFELGQNLYVAIDSYCLKEGCSCNGISLSFMNFKHDIKSKRIPPVTIIDYNPINNKWKCLDEDVNLHGPQVLMQECLKKYPQFAATCKKRKKHLSILYKSFLKKKGIETTSAENSGSQKIGRNDPCPCGSGKKYKKCCGAN